MSDMNEEFFEEIRNTLGMEAYEEFSKSDVGEKLKSYDDQGVNLHLLQDIISFLRQEVEHLQNLNIKDPLLIRALIRGLVFELIVKMYSDRLHDDVSNILYIISDGIVDLIIGEKI